jgi:hypothetical protein
MFEPSPAIRDEALAYYDAHGWFVLPTDPGAKKPFFGFTYKDRYGANLPARGDIESWSEWTAKGVRLGTRTGEVSGIIVLDVDSQEAHDYIKAKQHPICPMVQSPREGGGLHLYFEHPDFYVKSTVGVGGVEGLDIRGDGGIVVLPPSPDHKSGRAYEWIIPPGDVAIPPAPTWLLDLLKDQSTFKEKLDIPRIMAGVPEGRRDTELNRLAGKFRQMNIPEDVAVPMIELAAEKCSPPFGKAEARAKVKWAYTHYEAGEDAAAQAPILDTAKTAENDDRFKMFNLQDLMQEEFPSVKWIIPSLVPEGTMLFAGKPKMGKSWAALGFCIAVATGGKAFGEYEVEEGAALYLALEDNKRRLQSRAGYLLKSDLVGAGSLSNLDLQIRAGRLDTGLLEELERWLDKHGDRARLIVLDTLASVRGRSTNIRTLYEQDYEVGAALTKLAGDYSVALVPIHHLKKGDADDPLDLISGSTGLTGGMDGAMVLTRTRSAADGILKAVHRDLENDPEIALQLVDKAEGWWKYAGEGEEYRLGKERREILEVLANADEPLKPREIAEALDKPTPNVSKLLQKMREDGDVDNEGYGRYVPRAGVSTLTTAQPVQVVQPIQVEPPVEPGPVKPDLDRQKSAHLQELGPLGPVGPVYEDAKESKREAPSSSNPPDEEEEEDDTNEDGGAWKNHKALEALRTPKLAPMVQQFFDGKADCDTLAGAVAAHYQDGGRWEDWREPTVRALTALDEEANRVPEPEGIAEDRPIEEED